MQMPSRLVICTTVIVAALPATDSAAQSGYLRHVKPILRARCYSCHGAIRQEGGLRLDTAAAMLRGGDSGPAAVAGDSESLILQRVTADESDRMPPEGSPLSKKQIAHLSRWIDAGAVAPEDESGQPDPETHWAFQPVPEPDDGLTIDTFIRRRLRAAGLELNPPADATTLVRRFYLDLHGLPPSPEQVREWTHRIGSEPGRDPAAVAALIDALLASPRYGERWAQHWLDVVRYADTHGFEVNTPRPNAWPYRDYVIRAFNEDKPYDEFVVDQIAGDATGEGAATGFLVAAAALLPGQIGQDEPSKRLARQDALDEIVVGTSASFLGLTIGCARCHDHKFDPFTQRDYYTLQAYFAGVDYGDREIRDDTFEQRRAQARALDPQIEQLASRLRRFEPIAGTARILVIDDEDPESDEHPGSITVLQTKNGHGVNPPGTQRGYRDDVGSGDRLPNISHGRYTWWPNTPGVDVLTWNPAVAGRFRIWISWGAHGSGVHTRDARYLLDRDGDLDSRGDQTEIARVDQYYMAGVEEGESEKKPLWSGLQSAGVHDLTVTTRLVLRGGETGTGITADVVVLEEIPDVANTGDVSLPRLRAPVDPRMNVERFSPVTARFVRFTTFATIDSNRHEPCIDELEVFTSGANPRNVALADEGTVASSSGNYANSGKHQLRHINDGRYGNDRSWISNQRGAGWVQLEFPRAHEIDRIEWARDRTGKFRDRLSQRYVIATSLNGRDWQTVASSDDRARTGTPWDAATALSRTAGTTSAAARRMIDELNRLKSRKAELEAPRLAFAGQFRVPDATRLLNRGDPEQPGELLTPHVPQVLGQVGCSADDPEQARRLQLARWMADPANPLTARVFVNRVWQYHFGTGLVDTPSDFGLSGSRPSHPQLLDWLAAEFIRGGWSVKRLHRLILSSATYQQSHALRPKARTVDADCRLLWRFPLRRLEAEAIRDSVLAVSGQLNLKMGGPGFSFFKTRGGLSGFPPIEDFNSEHFRRMVYSHRIRMEPVPVFGAFDCPDAGQPTPRRSVSTTAIQALNLFNSPFMLQQSRVFAERVRREAGDDLAAQVRRAWLIACGRVPRPVEQTACVTAASGHGIEIVCRALLNSSEFLFIP